MVEMVNVTHKTLFLKLQKYYRREGNKILFSNGKNLSEIAFSLWEALGYRSIDTSVLSRFLKGERLLTLSQFAIFCALLDISDQDQKELTDLLNQEFLSRSNQGENLAFLQKNTSIEEVRHSIDAIKKARAFDAPHLALELSDYLEAKISILLKDETRETYRIELFKLQADVLMQKGIILLEAFPFALIVHLFAAIGKKIKNIGEVTHERLYLAESEAMKGRILFHYKNYNLALKYDLAALEFINDPDIKACVAGRIGIESAFLDRQKDTAAMQALLLEEVTKKQLDDETLCFIFNHVSEMNSILKRQNEAHKYIALAQKIHADKLNKQGKYGNIRRVQLNNAIYFFNKTFSAVSKQQNIKILANSFDISSTCGYLAYIRDNNKLPTVLV